MHENQKILFPFWALGCIIKIIENFVITVFEGQGDITSEKI